MSAQDRSLDPGALKALARGECPDGGGPQCVCAKVGRPGQCVSLANAAKCTACDDDGRFRLGMSTDTCGECFGTKYIDPRVLEAMSEGGLL